MAQNNWWSNKWGNIQPFFGSVKSAWSGFLKIWKDSEIVFGQTDFTWGEKAAAEEVAQVINGGKSSIDTVYDWGQWQKNNEQKKKKVIKLLCKIKGEKFEEEKDYKNVKLTIRDAKLIVNKVLGTKVDVVNESIKLAGEDKWHINSIQIKTKNSSAR